MHLVVPHAEVGTSVVVVRMAAEHADLMLQQRPQLGPILPGNTPVERAPISDWARPAM